MTKKIIALFVAVILLLGTQTSVFAESTKTQDGAETTREEVMQERPEITRREATISMLLDAGWTLDEIDDWYTEEALSELDENALAVSNNAIYTKYYDYSEDGEPETVELSRQAFDYELNQVQCAKEDHDNTSLSTLSSNGVLELQPVYDWNDMNGETRNDRLYMGQSGYSGSSIWNSDNSCYLKQNMGLVWMANDTYQVQYRFEWKKEPHYRRCDYFAVAPATDLVVHSNPRETLTFRYSLAGQDCTENLTSTNLSWGHKWCTMSSLSMGQGRQVKIVWPEFPEGYGTSLRGYLSYYLKINNKYTYDEFIAYAQYYHGKFGTSTSASIGVSISGPSASFSISGTIKPVAETHPMEVRAKNIYK